MRKIFWRIGLLAIPLVWVAAAGAQPRYEIRASVDTDEKTISAQQRVTYQNRSEAPLHEIFFHIYPNRRYSDEEKSFMMRYAGYFNVDAFPDGFPVPDMHFSDVRVNDIPGAFEIMGEDDTLLKVLLEQPLMPGEEAVVSMGFTLRIPHSYGRFGWIDDIFALSRWYPVLSVHDERGWNNPPFYPFHRPFFSDAAIYDVELTVAEDMCVIHTGTLDEERATGEGKKTLKISTRLPVREFTLALSPRYRVMSTRRAEAELRCYYLPGDEEHAAMALDSAGDLMEFYTQLFGEYPYEQFSIAPVHLAYGGEQMSNMVFMDTRVFDEPRILKRHFDFLIAHETGHQWFYNLVGMDEFSEMWLEEGVNSYFILQYLEAKYGENAEVVEWPEWIDWLLPNTSFRKARDYRYKIIARTNWDYPVQSELSSYEEPSSIFSITYGKGSAIMAMLRYTVGEEAFRAVFRRIFREYRFGNLSTKDFVRIAEEESGKDLGEFFRQWLRTAEYFDYAVNAVEHNAIHVENRGGIAVDADVLVVFEDGRTQDLVWGGDKERDVLLAGDGGRIREVIVDPQKALLDIDRTNNYWPRRLNVEPVPLYLSLYDMSLFLPEDAYNLVVGPEIIANGLGMKASLQKPFDQNFYAATGYEFGEQLHKTRVGYQVKNVFHTLATAGFELFNTTDLENGDRDLVGGKIYLRKELWPMAYGLSQINDHVTFYLIRNREINRGTVLEPAEDDRNISYLRKNEAVAGAALFFDRSEPVLDPSQGYRVSTFFEHSGHFLGATQSFNRGGIDVSLYRPVTVHSQAALRLKFAGGYPNDRSLFELGGPDGLRGYDRKTLRGANIALGSLEYRFPIIPRMDVKIFDNIIGFEAVDGVVFAEAGHNWFKAFNDSDLKKDAGVGLRFHVSLGSFLEKIIVRVDAAQAIRDPKKDTRFWFGVNHAF